MIQMIVAYDDGRVIGAKGELPWQGKMPADMKWFRDKTADCAVIMGRTTYDSIGRPLPKRHNIVISRSMVPTDGVTVVSNIQDAYKAAGSQKVFVIGGSQIYNLALDTTDIIYATEIHTHSPNGDAFFPELPDDEWQEAERKDFPADDENTYPYSFVTYTRR